MNCLSFCVLLAVAIVHVNAGGYVLKGGVVDFGKPLDYFDQAVQAGESCGVDFIKLGLLTNWSSRSNPEDRINRKSDDQENDQTTEKANNHNTESTVLNPIFGSIYI